MSTSRINVFVIAGTRLLRETLVRIFTKRGDLTVAGVDALSPEGISRVEESSPDVVVLDSVAGISANLDFVRHVRHLLPETRVVMIGMEENEDLFLRCVKAGARGYVLREASAVDVIHAVRMVAKGEAVCPSSLCLALFREVARQPEFPSIRIKLQFGLTRREQQLVPFIARGLTNKEIAAHLNLSEQTIKNHIHRMMQKIGADDRLSIVEQCLGVPKHDLAS